jgi:hypothetical protein
VVSRRLQAVGSEDAARFGLLRNGSAGFSLLLDRLASAVSGAIQLNHAQAG